MSETIRIEVRRGRFNWAEPGGEEINVYIRVPGVEVFNLSLSVEQGEDLMDKSLPWSYIIREASRRWLDCILLSTRKKEVEHLAAWAAEDDNADLCDRAWAEYELPMLNAQIARLETRRPTHQQFSAIEVLG